MLTPETFQTLGSELRFGLQREKKKLILVQKEKKAQQAAVESGAANGSG